MTEREKSQALEIAAALEAFAANLNVRLTIVRARAAYIGEETWAAFDEPHSFEPECRALVAKLQNTAAQLRRAAT